MYFSIFKMAEKMKKYFIIWRLQTNPRNLEWIFINTEIIVKIFVLHFHFDIYVGPMLGHCTFGDVYRRKFIHLSIWYMIRKIIDKNNDTDREKIILTKSVKSSPGIRNPEIITTKTTTTITATQPQQPQCNNYHVFWQTFFD